jgi:hypothetical protein
VPAKPDLHLVRLPSLERRADGGDHLGSIVRMNQTAPAFGIDLLKRPTRKGDPR